jgi:hypothetical protein
MVRPVGWHWSQGLPAEWCGTPPQELRSWATAQRTAAAAWGSCTRGEWLLWALGHAGADLPTLALSTCEIVREVLPLVPRSERWPPRVLELVALLATRGPALGQVSRRELLKACRGSALARDTSRRQMSRTPAGSEAYHRENAVYHAINALSNLSGLLSRWELRATPRLSSFHPESWVFRACEEVTMTLAHSHTAQNARLGDLWAMIRRKQAHESTRFADQLRQVRWPLPVARAPLQSRPELQVLWDFVSERTGAGPFLTVQLLEAYFFAPSLLELLAAPSEDERKLIAALTFRIGTDEALWREVHRMLSSPA